MQNDQLPDDDQEMPKLDIRQENEFKKMKMSLEHGAVFPTELSQNLPPEIESAFLDSIINFEKAFRDSKKITIFDKLGKPHFVPENVLNDDEIDIEIDKVQDLLGKNNIRFDVLAEDEYSNREIYKFLTEDFINEEVEEIQLKGMISFFNYEDYRPNHRYSITESTRDFIDEFMHIDSKTYEDHDFENEDSKKKIDAFRNKFQRLDLINLEITDLIFDDKTAKTTFDISFEGYPNPQQKFNFSGIGSITFKFEYGFWYTDTVDLPFDSNPLFEI